MIITLNIRYLLRLTLIAIIVGLLVHLLHRRQASRQSQTFLTRAEDAQKRGDFNRTIEYFSRYLVLAPHDADVRARMGFLMARAARKPDRKLQAYFVLEQALREDRKREDVRRRNVRLAMEPSLHMYTEALAHLEVLKAAHPDDWEVRDLIGQCQAATGEFDSAKDSFAEAIQRKPSSFESYARQATILRRKLNNPEKADTVVEAMIKANAEEPVAHLFAASYWKEFDHLDKAEAAVAAALKLAPHQAEVLLTAADYALARGEAMRQKGLADKSNAELETARGYLQLGIDKNSPPEIDPALAENEQDDIAKKRALVAAIYRGLVDLEVRIGRLPEAEKAVRAGIELLPEQFELALSLADVLIRQERFNEATELLTKLQGAGYAVAVLDYHRARMLAFRSRWVEASLVLEAAIPDLIIYPALCRQAYFLLAECYDRMGELDLRYKALVEARPSNSEVYDPLWAPAFLALAAAQAEMGRTNEAIHTYGSVLSYYPSAALPLARLLFVENLRQPREKWDWGRVEKLLKIAPDSIDSVLLRAEVLMVCGLSAFAQQALHQAKEKYAGEASLWVEYAYQAFYRKDEPATEKALMEAQAKFGDRVEIRLARSRFLSAPLSPAAVQKLTSLAEGIDGFSPDVRRRLLRGLSDRAAELGAIDLAATLWDRLAIEQPDNLGVHFKRFDRAVQINDEAVILHVIADIRRIDGSGGTSTRMARALYLIWKAQRGDPSGLDEARDHLLELEQKRSGLPRIALGLALVYDLKQDIDTAIPNYRQAIDRGERDPAVLQRLIELYYRKQNYTEAEAVLSIAPEAVAGREGMPFMAAEISLGMGKFTQALAMAEKAVTAEVKDYRKHLWLGRVRWLCGQRVEAEAPFRKAVELEGSVPETWIALIKYLSDIDRKPEAEKLFDEARRRINSEETALTLAQGYEILGRLDKAKQWYKRADAERPQNIAVLRNVANFCLRQGMNNPENPKERGEYLKEAEEYLKRVILLKEKTQSDLDSARRLLAITLSLSPDYESSRRAFELMGLFETSPTASLDELRARAVVLTLQPGRRSRQESIQLFEAIDARRPLPPEDQFLLAQTYNRLGDYDKAYVQLRRLTKAKGNPLYPVYVSYYLRFLLEHGYSLIEAKEWLSVLENLQPDAPQTAELRARFLVADKKKEEAVAGLADFVNKHKDMALPVARLLEELKEFDVAESLYRQATESKAPAAGLILAVYLGRRGRNQEAVDQLEKDVKSAPAETLALAGLKVLYALDRLRPDDIRRVRLLLESNRPVGVNFQLAEAALQNLEGNYAGAISIYQGVLQRDPKNLLAMNNLAFLMAFHEKKHNEALALIRKARSETKSIATLLSTEAMIHISGKTPEPAIELLLDAIADEPKASSYFYLAEAYEQGGNHASAAIAMDRAKKLGLRRSDLHPLEYAKYEEMLNPPAVRE
jgi:cellulose synthase operon protein C